MLRSGRGRIAVLAVALLAFTATAALAGSGETKSYKIKPGRTAIFDLESGGSVTIIGWDKSEVEVSYYETGRGHDHVVEISELDGDIFIGSEMEFRSGRSKSLDFVFCTQSAASLLPCAQRSEWVASTSSWRSPTRSLSQTSSRCVSTCAPLVKTAA